MSIRGRATLGAVLVCVGLLMVTGAGSYKATALIKHERKVAKGEPSEAPDTSGATMVSIIGWALCPFGVAMVVVAIRGMMRQIGETQSNIETQMRMEVAVKRDPKAKS